MPGAVHVLVGALVLALVQSGAPEECAGDGPAECAAHAPSAGPGGAARYGAAQQAGPEEQAGGAGGAGCPALVQPHDIGFFVINMARSTGRLRRMREAFAQHPLGPMGFERIEGPLVDPARHDEYEAPRWGPRDRGNLGTWGCALGHYRAWAAAAASPHPWSIIFEDDAVLIDSIDYQKFDPVPADHDMVLLRAETVSQSEEVCAETSIRLATWGYGLVGYLTSREGARRLLQSAERGVLEPVDGHIWSRNKVYTTAQNYVTHKPCQRPCDESVRLKLDGRIEADPGDA